MPIEDKVETPATDTPFENEVVEAEAVDEQLFTEASPVGRFSSKALNTLVQATNKLLPVFDQTGDYPEFDAGTYETWPADFVRVMSMFSQASTDAVSEDVVPAELAVSLDGITDDSGVQLIAGKLQALAKSKDFKTWLKEPTPEQEVEPVEGVPEGGETMSEDDIDALFLDRL